MPSRNRPNDQVKKINRDERINLIGLEFLAGSRGINFSFRVFLEGSRYFLEPFCARLLLVGLFWWQNGSFSKKEEGAGVVFRKVPKMAPFGPRKLESA